MEEAPWPGLSPAWTNQAEDSSCLLVPRLGGSIGRGGGGLLSRHKEAAGILHFFLTAFPPALLSQSSKLPFATTPAVIFLVPNLCLASVYPPSKLTF